MSNLRFNPPEWLIQEYFNRPRPQDVLAQQLNDMANQSRQRKQQAAQLALAKEQRNIEKAKALTEGGTDFLANLNAVSGQGGTTLQPPPAPPQIQTTPTQTPATPTMGGFQQTPLEMQSQQSLPSQHPAGPIAAFFDQSANPRSTGPQPSRPPAPALGSDPAIQEFNQLGSQEYRRRHGTIGMQKVKQALDIQKALQETGDKSLSFADVRATFKAAQEPDLGELLISNANKQGLSKVPKDSVDEAIKGLSARAQGQRGAFYDISGEARRQQAQLALTKFAMEYTGGASLQDASKKASDRLGQLKRAGGIISQIEAQNNKASRRQAAEAAVSTVKALVGTGVATDSQINEFIPRTARTKFRDWQEFLTGEATNSDLESFAKEYRKLVDREIGINQDIINAAQQFGESATDLLSSYYPGIASAISRRAKTNPLISPAPPPGATGTGTSTGMENLSDDELRRIINGE